MLVLAMKFSRDSQRNAAGNGSVKGAERQVAGTRKAPALPSLQRTAGGANAPRKRNRDKKLNIEAGP
jgi:hypothetical protein